MRILLLTRYDRLGASSRLRHLQYLPHLERAGMTVSVVPFFDDRYLQTLYAGGEQGFGAILGHYGRRLAVLLQCRRFDLLWIEKEALPFLPAWLEALLTAGVPAVIDYDDAWFHRYDCHPNPLVRRMLGRRIDQVMARARLIVAGNAYLAARARTAGAGDVRLLPTVIDLARYPVPPDRPPGDPFVIGWIGSPSTVGYVRGIAPALAEVCAGSRAVLRVIGGDPGPLPGVPVELAAWSEGGEAAALAGLDAGIMPLSDTPWEHGKCGYKLLQYMAAARPTVASPVGMNVEIITDGVTGFLCRDLEDWARALVRLRDDPAGAARMGHAGRARVETSYALNDAAVTLIGYLRDAGGDRFKTAMALPSDVRATRGSS
jgi:glycosyltransferase involved in cell wall biosynthesis